MAIHSFHSFSLTSACLIWKIEESIEALLAQLHPNFLDDFFSLQLSSKKKIAQSLAVRIALASLLNNLNLPVVSLSKTEQGKPILVSAELHLSFTHTPYLAAVALSKDSSIGIDIEMVSPSLRSVQEKFLNVEERKNADNCFEALAIYWSAKEALYKSLDSQAMISFRSIFIEPFHIASKGKVVAHLEGNKYQIGYQAIADGSPYSHVLAWSERTQALVKEN